MLKNMKNGARKIKVNLQIILQVKVIQKLLKMV